MNASERHQALTRIFIAVCGLTGDLRKSELDRLCRDHPELRSEVESLLAFHDAPSADADPRRRSR
jgi:hypothetical protein